MAKPEGSSPEQDASSYAQLSRQAIAQEATLLATHNREVPKPTRAVSHYRTIFISDLHLGTRSSQVRMLRDFLLHTSSDQLYLVGDIIDGWALKKRWYWDRRHNDVVALVLNKAREGTEVIYIPGNHDEFLRDYDDLSFGDIALMPRAIHTAADGKRFLVIHGDEFDNVMQYAKWMAHIGSTGYGMLLWLNTRIARIRRFFGLSYWSLSAMVKNRVKRAVNVISDFSEFIASEARRENVQGVICGHIHQAEMSEIDGVLYYNDGDWVESMTALVEDDSGAMRILHWPTELKRLGILKRVERGLDPQPLPEGIAQIGAAAP